MRGAPPSWPRPATSRSGTLPGRRPGERNPARAGDTGVGSVMQSALQTLYNYWNEVRAGQLAPQRLDIEPSRIAAILSQTFILELLEPDTCPYRLAGTRLSELFGSELRGKNFLDGFSDADRGVLASRLASIGEQGAVAHLILEGILDARHRVEIEANLLPLLHGGKITRIIGAMSVTSPPHWLGSEPLRSRRLKQHQLVWPDGRPHASVLGQNSQAPFDPALSAPGARVVKDEQRRFRVV